MIPSNLKLNKVSLHYEDGSVEFLSDTDAHEWMAEINQAVVILGMNVKDYEFPRFRWKKEKKKKEGSKSP
jgi:hypothetical protein